VSTACPHRGKAFYPTTQIDGEEIII